nr:hypothetical protein GCM10020241_46270 [Streptoalloteichus tenebrarius]
MAAITAVLGLSLPLTQSVAHANPGHNTGGAGSTADPAAAAAGWAGRQLRDGERVDGRGGVDYGLTADIVLGLASAGTGRETAAKATDWLASKVDAYFRGDNGLDLNTGGLAKLALVAQVQHRDPTNFGGRDLFQLLYEQLGDDGKFEAIQHGKDSANTFTQSLALLALHRQGKDMIPEPAVDFLVRTRCANGGFPVVYWAKPDECKSDADGTGIVVQALIAVGRAADAAPALDWLERIQNSEGGFSETESTATPNANSTALAAQALRAGGRAHAADRAISWLLARQVGCSGKEEDRGAVGWEKPVVTGSTLRATAQVIPALANRSLAEIDGAGARPGLPVLLCVPGSSSSAPPTSSSSVPSIPGTPPTSGNGNGSTPPSTTAPSTPARTTTAAPVAAVNAGGGGPVAPRPQAVSTRTTTLAKTGAAVDDLALVGGGLVLVGVVLVVAGRTRRRAAR